MDNHINNINKSLCDKITLIDHLFATVDSHGMSNQLFSFIDGDTFRDMINVPKDASLEITKDILVCQESISSILIFLADKVFNFIKYIANFLMKVFSSIFEVFKIKITNKKIKSNIVKIIRDHKVNALSSEYVKTFWDAYLKVLKIIGVFSGSIYEANDRILKLINLISNADKTLSTQRLGDLTYIDVKIDADVEDNNLIISVKYIGYKHDAILKELEVVKVILRDKPKDIISAWFERTNNFNIAISNSELKKYISNMTKLVNMLLSTMGKTIQKSIVNITSEIEKFIKYTNFL